MFGGTGSGVSVSNQGQVLDITGEVIQRDWGAPLNLQGTDRAGTAWRRVLECLKNWQC